MFKQIQYANFPLIVLTVLALLVSLIPLPFLGNIYIPWMVAFIFLEQCDNDYYFTPIFICLISLVFDFFTGGLLGMTSVLMLIMARLVYNHRFILRGQILQIKWIFFSIWVFVFTLLSYLIISLASRNFISVVPSIISFLILSLTYPMFYRITLLVDQYE